jgi:hypothetical protein
MVSAVDREPIVAIGLLTDTHVRMLGSSLKQVFPLADDHAFDDLLRALDEVDREEG